MKSRTRVAPRSHNEMTTFSEASDSGSQSALMPSATKRRDEVTRPLISVVITAHNEGDEVARTIDSIRENTKSPIEILLVDDASTDGCCDILNHPDCLRVIRRPVRVGVANSRMEASRLARGDVLAYFDAHQRVESGCLDECAQVARAHHAIVTPDILDFDGETRLHGAYSVICRQRHFLSAEWKYRTPTGALARVSALRAPTYLIPRSAYEKVEWSSQLRGWGGSEAAISMKAFFAGVPILHLCGPLVLHRFRRAFHYDVKWAEIWRNQAITARICFDERSWYEYWLPDVFDANLTDEVRAELNSDVIRSERLAFTKLKIRRDEEFWSSLVFERVPARLK